MDEKLKGIIKDYDDCINVQDCGKCKAKEIIEGTETCYCDFLRHYTDLIFEKIEKIFI